MSTSTVGISGYTLQNIVSLAQATLETLRTEHGQVIETDSDITAALAALFQRAVATAHLIQ